MTPDEKDLLARVPDDLRRPNAIPGVEQTRRAERAVRALRGRLGDRLTDDGVRVSPLGAGWSRDIDVYPIEPPDEAQLAEAGWLRLDGLLGEVGRSACRNWAIVERGEILGCADLHRGRPPDPLEAVLARCARRREVRVREMLELRRLVRRGVAPVSGRRALAAAAAIESWLGGDLLSGHLEGPAAPGPVALPRPVWRRGARVVRDFLRPRLTLALSGVDGSGKSTVARMLSEHLTRAGVPAGAVWARPGMHLGKLTRISRAIKRFVGQDPGPGVRAVVEGRGDRLRSRRGVIGWSWSLIVATAFLVDVWRQHLTARGVVLYDRHAADAAVTLRVLYRGPDLRLQRALVRRLLPRPTLTAYLEIDAETAAARKPGDMIDLATVRAQLQRYEDELSGIHPLVRVDARAEPEQGAWEILGRFLAALERDQPRDPGPGKTSIDATSRSRWRRKNRLRADLSTQSAAPPERR